MEPCLCGDPECGRCFPKGEDVVTRERYPHPDKGQPELHVVEDPDGHWEVWLNTGIADYDGIVIGTGDTRDLAVGDAVRVVEWIEQTLQGPSPSMLRRVLNTLQ